MRSQSAISGVTLTVAANLVLIGLTTGRAILTARLLGPAGRGELTAILAVPMFLSSIGLFGLPDATVFFASKRSNPLNLVVTNWLILLPVAILLVGVGYLIMPLFMTKQTAEVIVAARLYLLIIPLAFISQVAQGAHLGKANFALWNKLRMLKPLLFTVSLLILWLLVAVTSSNVSLLWLISNLIGTLVIVGSLTIYGALLKASPQRVMVPPMLKYGIQSALGSMPEMLNTRLDQLVMVAFISATELGLYTVAVSWSLFLLPIADAIVSVMFPYIAEADEIDKAARRFTTTARIGLLVTTMICGVMLLIAPIAFPIVFGADFKAAVPAAMVLTLGAVAWQYNRTLSAGLKGLGYPIADAVGQGTGLIVTFLLLFLLLPRLGIMGAAIASLMAYVTACIVLLLFTKSKTDVSMRSLLLPKQSDLKMMWQYFLQLRNRLTSFFISG